jgi:hypothetical protein
MVRLAVYVGSNSAEQVQVTLRHFVSPERSMGGLADGRLARAVCHDISCEVYAWFSVQDMLYYSGRLRSR